MSEPTPGPWLIEPLPNSSYAYAIDHIDHLEDAGCNGFPPYWRVHIAEIIGSLGDDVDIANARLIAAAPTMYDYISDRAKEGDDRAIAILSTLRD